MARFTPKTFVKVLIAVYIIVFIYALTNYKARVVFSQPDFIFEDSNFFMISNNSQKCRLNRSDLKEVTLNVSSAVSLASVEKENPHLQLGGKWEPTDCEPWQKVAIIIPYRDRAFHLKLIMNRLHPMLKKQKIAYQMFLAVQAGEDHFSRGRLGNIAFIEVLKIQKFDCIIFHDVDLLPETDRNIYLCDAHARHLSPAIDEQRYHPIFNNYFGAVMALSVENYWKVNGFGNRYAGWGNEDDDLSARTYAAGLYLTRPPYNIGRYKMVRHMKSGRSEHGYENFLEWRYWWKKDGLSNIDEIKYKVLSIAYNKLYTNITIDVGLPPPPPPTNIPKEGWLWFLWFYVP